MLTNMQSLDGTIWLAEPTRFKLAIDRVARIAACPSARELAAYRKERLEDFRQSASKAVRSAKGKIGVIPVYGPVDQRQSPGLMKAGGTSTEEISAAFDSLLADSSVEAIVFDVDSPGGGVYGVEELSDKIVAARGRKKTYAVANSMAASAAYWLASSAEFFAVTPGGDVGSVGVYCVHVDQSRAMESQGISVTMVHAGKYKTELAPVAPLSEEAKGSLQESVNYTYGKFLKAVKRNRNTTMEDVRINYGQGRVMNADDALKAKMIDRVMTFEELMHKLTGGTSANSGRGRADLQMMRMRQVQRKREMEVV